MEQHRRRARVHRYGKVLTTILVVLGVYSGRLGKDHSVRIRPKDEILHFLDLKTPLLTSVIGLVSDSKKESQRLTTAKAFGRKLSPSKSLRPCNDERGV